MNAEIMKFSTFARHDDDEYFDAVEELSTLVEVRGCVTAMQVA
jgi:hypothetical protein